MRIARTAYLVFSVALAATAPGCNGCGGCSQPHAAAAAPAAETAPEADSPSVAMPTDPLAVAARGVADKYWSAVSKGDISAIRALTAGELNQKIDKALNQVGPTAFAEQLRSGQAMRTVAPGEKIGDDLYRVRSRSTTGHPFTATLTIQRTGSDWRVVTLKADEGESAEHH